ncbi:MAG: hypothetical protein GY929_06270 [Actinomycetia bacterium]|nr:hypothetical protein [Actinomycetes bacterium]
MAWRRLPVLVAAIIVVGAEPAHAHGVAGRSDLPLPLWLFTYGAGAILLVSFAALRALWHRPRLRAAASGRVLGAGTVVQVGQIAMRLIGLTFWLLTVAALWLGTDNQAANIAPVSIYIVFWVGVPVLSLLFGDVWRALDPLDTLAALGERLGLVADRRSRAGAPVWTAALMIFAFVWLELAYHEATSISALRIWFTLHTVAALGGAAVYGRAWIRDHEGFAVLFGLMGQLGPLTVREGRLRARWILTGITERLPAAAPSVILVALGSTTFDGFTRTDLWLEITGARSGWGQTFVATIGLVWVIGLMGLAWAAANHAVAQITGRRRAEMIQAFMPSLVPIAVAYAVAHYLSLLLFEGQIFLAQLSDPLGRGWDLFGTVQNTIDYTVASTDAVAYVQAGTMVVGHVWGVLVAHDRALEMFEPNEVERSQYPILAVMVLYTVGGLAILLGR